ncbi:MAG TPA: hypothetical protein VJT85_11610 [Gemmatimonadaceae bacterium]|nr:hypothetical protein [Gemmatimonadaceae bacterium]
MKLRTALFTLFCSAGLASVAHAQQKDGDVPKDYRPPRGMCRIWLDDVPARQQPAPTDCPTAVRNRPSNGKVVFGDDFKDGKGSKDGKDSGQKGQGRDPAPFLRKFGEDRKKP